MSTPVNRVPTNSGSATLTPRTATVPAEDTKGSDPGGSGGTSGGTNGGGDGTTGGTNGGTSGGGDGTVTLTPTEFKVDLAQLATAIRTVTTISQEINSDMLQISAEFDQISTLWVSPSSAYLKETTDWFTTEQTALHDLLDEVVNRLTTAYQNYESTESANSGNMS